MAARHHHCHPATASCSCCCCYTTCCDGPQPDSLLQSLSSHFRHPPSQPYPPSNSQSFHHHHHYHQETPFYPPPAHHQHRQEQFQAQPTVSSLLRRIAALESALRRQASVNSSSPYSLRDAAARTIQTHFREFLVRRSRKLRQLKDLASIKSTLNALKASVYDDVRPYSRSLSRRALGLLHKLDSIQGGDQMIRDHKRSISRDLNRFLEFLDGERNKVSSVVVKNVKFGRVGNKSRVFCSGQKIGAAKFVDPAGGERDLIEKLKSRVEKKDGFFEEDGIEIELGNPRISIKGNAGLLKRQGGDQAKVKKTVSFADNGTVYRFTPVSQELSSEEVSGSSSIDDENELAGNLCREVQEIGGDEDEEAGEGESPEISDVERIPRRILRAGEDSYLTGGYDQDDDGSYVSSAPVPGKMEPRSAVRKSWKATKIVN
ncbi:BAG family molecular chaperone regulator 8, chloroplastic [Diospyros lotus]|uniref:BAG family molecular chaperone regulator 8, chloroplastic n=1 Tax=Diospyros lotus TaxID=55363 RepID=UPI0022595649|nr:BAG family molecular chaperone regulator 8, chloroplastic [Diospyros lotus]